METEDKPMGIESSIFSYIADYTRSTNNQSTSQGISFEELTQNSREFIQNVGSLDDYPTRYELSNSHLSSFFCDELSA